MNDKQEVGRSPLRGSGHSDEPASGLAAIAGSVPNAGGDPVVGHKTFCDDKGNRWHEPLRQSEADKLFAEIDADKERRAALMPDLDATLRMLGDVSERFRELGWRDAIYCPKDGSLFDAIEFGSTGVHTCSYDGEWPDGHWWVHDAGDLWPSRPVLFRERAGLEGKISAAQAFAKRDTERRAAIAKATGAV